MKINITSVVATAVAALAIAIGQESAQAQNGAPSRPVGWETLTTFEFNRDSQTGEVSKSVKLKRQTDEVSVELVSAFLEDREVELVLPNGEAMVGRVTGYSQNDDGTEEFSFGVEREMKESGEKGGTEPAQTTPIDPDTDKLPDLEPIIFATEPEPFNKPEPLFKVKCDVHPMALLLPAVQAAREAARAAADSFSFGVEREMKESGE